LKNLLKRIDAIILNDGEAKRLTKLDNLPSAAQELIKMGPKLVVIKKGANGSIVLDRDGNWFMLGGFPAVNLKDPTGAGDSFAGAFMGYLAAEGRTDWQFIKKAVAYGTVTASIVIEGFSLSTISSASKSTIDKRLNELKVMTEF
jgi:sugar/nucleoside kinase (ribokinase family)